MQVTFAGYPGTTGLETIDYRLTDPYLDPPGDAAVASDAVYAEQSVRLADSFWIYDPLSEEPAVNPPPVLASGIVTFGCLSNFCKINDAVLQLWAQVLRQVQGSRLVLLAKSGSHRQRTLNLLEQEGIEPGRIEFLDYQPRPQYLQAYHHIDIGLDTFPYNGHTTSLDSFWMGVPVVTLAGQTAVGRAGWSQLCNLGLPELAAGNAQEFVQIAAQLAGDLERLAEQCAPRCAAHEAIAVDGCAALRRQYRGGLPHHVAALVRAVPAFAGGFGRHDFGDHLQYRSGQVDRHHADV